MSIRPNESSGHGLLRGVTSVLVAAVLLSIGLLACSEQGLDPATHPSLDWDSADACDFPEMVDGCVHRLLIDDEKEALINSLSGMVTRTAFCAELKEDLIRVINDDGVQAYNYDNGDLAHHHGHPGYPDMGHDMGLDDVKFFSTGGSNNSTLDYLETLVHEGRHHFGADHEAGSTDFANPGRCLIDQI